MSDSAFQYRNGQLCAEQVKLSELAQTVGTPFYCYSSGAISGTYTRLTTALKDLSAHFFYAVKANGNQAVIRTLAELGAGADIVSEGEMHRALAAGIPANKILFAGVGKSAEEMSAALEADILQFNVESEPELRLLSQLACRKDRTARVALRINPDVDALTLAGISTGKAENKFGIDMDLARDIVTRRNDFPGIALEGLAVHIGSQLTDLSPYRLAFRRLVALFKELRAQGLDLKRLDLGGGLGIRYQEEKPPDLEVYAQIVREETAGLEGVELAFEPGRFLVGNAGILVTRVLYVKESGSRRFLVLDAAMNDLIRPMLYEAWHDILPVREADPAATLAPVDLVGPVCETTDTFAKQRDLPPVQAGDLLAICSTGAYGAVMSSTYNCRLPAQEVMVKEGDFAVVRPRGDYAALIEQDRLPAWLSAPS
ncbi:MAG: diaminopimelate decarboxylase [Pseudomonadota bacterium]